MELKTVEWKNIKNKDFDILATKKDRGEILLQIGYETDREGYLVDSKTKDRIKAEDGSEISISDEDLGLFVGSHVFVKNVASFSQYLANKGLLKIKARQQP